MKAFILKKNVLVHDSPPHPVYILKQQHIYGYIYTYCRWASLLKQQMSITLYRLPTKENKLPFHVSFVFCVYIFIYWNGSLYIHRYRYIYKDILICIYIYQYIFIDISISLSIYIYIYAAVSKIYWISNTPHHLWMRQKVSASEPIFTNSSRTCASSAANII